MVELQSNLAELRRYISIGTEMQRCSALLFRLRRWKWELQLEPQRAGPMRPACNGSVAYIGRFSCHKMEAIGLIFIEILWVEFASVITTLEKENWRCGDHQGLVLWKPACNGLVAYIRRFRCHRMEAIGLVFIEILGVPFSLLWRSAWRLKVGAAAVPPRGRARMASLQWFGRLCWTILMLEDGGHWSCIG